MVKSFRGLWKCRSSCVFEHGTAVRSRIYLQRTLPTSTGVVGAEWEPREPPLVAQARGREKTLQDGSREARPGSFSL